MALPTFSQTLGLTNLFKSSIKTGVVFIPEGNIGDSSATFGMRRFFLNSIIPLKTKIDAEFKLSELKKADLKARQSFLTANVGWRELSGSISGNLSIANASVGITGVRASLRHGVVFYTANIGFVQNAEHLEAFHPYFLGAVGRLKVKGLRKQNVYGLVLAYQWGLPLPIPILGWNRPLGKNWSMSILLPVSAQVSHRLSPRVKSAYVLNINSFRAGLIPNTAQTKLREIPTFMYSQLQLNWQLDVKISSRVALFTELGYTPFRQANIEPLLLRESNQSFMGVYGMGGLNFNIGKSPVNSQIFGNDF
ncbi:MAG: hypothetical protein EAZ57_07825 [Cytophagales bacterium]|nr:MAG: hypothetical protein EAZ67_08905 [Cytophagales bacterium]TAF60244.1 MAG: hypothetical protein EAZ57_07825 [Cytophagales bacterium]